MIEGSDGRWWAVFLAVRPQNGISSQLGRETFLLPIEWVDDWPIVNRREKARINGPAYVDLPRSSLHESWSYKFRADMSEFSQCLADLDLTLEGWYQPRTPLKVDFDLRSNPGSLTIHGGPYTLADDAALSMLLKKQTSFSGRWTARVDFDPQRPGEEAGVSIWWSKWCYASIGLRGEASAGSCIPQITFRQSDPDTEAPIILVSHYSCPR